MKTHPHTTTAADGHSVGSSRRRSAITMVLIGIAVLASMFVSTSQADARELQVAPDDGVAEITPEEWDCIINYEVEHVDFCIRLKEKPTSSDTGMAVIAAPTTKGPAKDLPAFFCPGGTVATPFDQPIYDENGLFVIGYETVWYCLPADLEPEG